MSEDIQQEEKTFYRCMSEGEVEAVRRTGLLRGGRGAGFEETYWTDELYNSAFEAKAQLALQRPPEVRVAFRITNTPRLLLEGTEVAPGAGEMGGGTEWMSVDAVEVEVRDIEDLD